ncbi:MAG: Tm-1-like ATP-binding domain-containing protein [Firmicutes bacterium]|nr:Tm-1-like ATP-binding domain-containing protein [Bacillota bacterium]
MQSARTVAVVATLDTKGPEALYVRDFVRSRGFAAIVVDVSTHGEPPFLPDIASAEVRQAAADMTSTPTEPAGRDALMKLMGTGAGRLLSRLCADGCLHGAIALGGNQGTCIAGIAMNMLPVGFPKLIVSTVASGNIRPYVGSKDIAMMFSVADILGGINPVTQVILANAAGAICGMAHAWTPITAPTSGIVVGITAFGNVEPTVKRCVDLLQRQGNIPMTFHASGAGGSAMEDLIEQGIIGAVIDIVTHELIGDLYAEDAYSPAKPGRLVAAGRAGIPQVVSLGGLDYFVFGPLSLVPQKYHHRKIHYHNPFNTNIRTTPDEALAISRLLAERLNAAKGPVAVIAPLQGWTEFGREGGPLYDPESDALFVRTLKDLLRPGIRVIELDANINDPVFSRVAVSILSELLDP